MDDELRALAFKAWGDDHEIFWFDDDGIEHFAALVAQREREACAKQLESMGRQAEADALRAVGATVKYEAPPEVVYEDD